jgi:hypothetical protein
MTGDGLVCVKSKDWSRFADSTEAVAPALTAAVVTNQIDVAGISLTPGPGGEAA